MKYDAQRSFGYPVLRGNLDDYVKGSFQPSISPQRKVSGDAKKMEFDCFFDVSPIEIKKLIQEKKASFVVVIDCRSTFFRDTFKFQEFKDQKIEIDAKLFKNIFEIQSYIIADVNITNFKCQHINKEYDNESFNFEKGSILAQAEPEEYSVEDEKFQGLKNLFQFSPNETYNDGEWYYDVMQDRPKIIANKKQCEYFQKMMHSKILLQNIILVPVVMEMLIQMYQFGAEEYKWVQTVETMLDQKNLVFGENFDYFRNAQLLLGYPMRQINNEFVEEE